MKNTIVAQNHKHLKDLISLEMHNYGHCCDLNHIDVSLITDMSCLFQESGFNGDISKWNTSNVTNMHCMFFLSSFNNDISQWDVSNVTKMGGMFTDSAFNGDISSWNVSRVETMSNMFYSSNFEQDISKWKPYSLERHHDMLDKCNAPKPWWLQFETVPHIGKAIQAYELSQLLDTQLVVGNQSKKIKL